MNRTPRALEHAMAILLLTFGAGAAAPVYHVNCQTGQKLAQRVSTAPPDSTIQITGVCQERLTITTDGLTLDGSGSAIIQGEGAGPVPSEFDPVVTIDGAQRVTLKGLTVQNGPGEGILARNGASFRLENITAQNNGNTGIVVSSNSTADFETITSKGNLFGLDVFHNSTVVMGGAITLTNNTDSGMSSAGNSSIDLRPAQINASNNGGFGLLIAGTEVDVFGFAVSQGSGITANGNGVCGLAIVSGGRLVVVSPPPFFGSGINIVSVKNNGTCGIFMPITGSLESPFGAARFIIENNPIGLNIGSNSGAFILGGLQVHKNGTGVLAEGAGSITFGSFPGNASSITGNTTTDVDLRFGSRITFCDITVGSVPLNDGTALTRTFPSACLLIPTM